jgi:hypothetical protein
MASSRYTDAEIYAHADEHRSIEQALSAWWDVESNFGTFELRDFEVHVGKHKGYDRDASPDYFLGWRTLIDVTAAPDTSDRAMVQFVTDLVAFLASAGYAAVAACGFEHELPDPPQPRSFN